MSQPMQQQVKLVYDLKLLIKQQQDRRNR